MIWAEHGVAKRQAAPQHRTSTSVCGHECTRRNVVPPHIKNAPQPILGKSAKSIRRVRVLFLAPLFCRQDYNADSIPRRDHAMATVESKRTLPPICSRCRTRTTSNWSPVSRERCRSCKVKVFRNWMRTAEHAMRPSCCPRPTVFNASPTAAENSCLTSRYSTRAIHTRALVDGFVSIALRSCREVISHKDKIVEVAKNRRYLAAGVLLVWLIDAVNKIAYIHREDGSVTKVYKNDELTARTFCPVLNASWSKCFQPRISQPDEMSATHAAPDHLTAAQ